MDDSADLSRAVSGALFPLGDVVATPGVFEAFGPLAHAMLSELVTEHVLGHPGELDAEDVEANRRALRDGDRILSCYTCLGVRCYVVTEADRSVTTVLLPSEY